MNIFLRWILFAALIVFTAWIIPGITVSNFLSAMLVCVILALINAFIKPLLTFITIPINVLTLGLFSFVINALMLWLAGYITPGFAVNGFLSALLGSIILAVFTPVINRIE